MFPYIRKTVGSRLWGAATRIQTFAPKTESPSFALLFEQMECALPRQRRGLNNLKN